MWCVVRQVAEIKQRAEKEHDIGEAASMKLIHQGKILKDTQTLGTTHRSNQRASLTSLTLDDRSMTL